MNNASSTLLVHEIYSSIQGESTWAGLPCFFIRLTGCPLRCVWCDTTYAFTGGTQMTIPELVAAACGSGIPLVEVTGGEPLAQSECANLCQALLECGKTVLIETAGAHPIEVLPEGVIRIIDLKCPDSGEMERNRWDNLKHLTRQDELKFVLASRRDYEWARDCVLTHHLAEKAQAVLFSPVFGVLASDLLVSWILEDQLPVRFQLQLHKYIWHPHRKGV
jgi:7-carboxy-7-deazaguanine synthase